MNTTNTNDNDTNNNTNHHVSSVSTSSVSANSVDIHSAAADRSFLILLCFFCFLAIAHHQGWFGLFGNAYNKQAGQLTNPIPSVKAEVKVTFFNVSEGEAILIQSPEGRNMLVDGGPNSDEMLQFLRQRNIKDIDIVVATHDDPQHIGGLLATPEFEPKQFIGNALVNNPNQGSSLWRTLINNLEDQGTIFEEARNQNLQLGSVNVNIIAPPEYTRSNSGQNNQSVAVRVEYGNFTTLLTGDSENAQTAAWMESGANVKGPMQVYQGAPSDRGDNARWLNYVKPNNVVIHIGKLGSYVPTPEIFQRYRNQGAEVYRTDQQGTISFIGYKNGRYTVKIDE